LVKERLQRTRRSGRIPVRRGQWPADGLQASRVGSRVPLWNSVRGLLVRKGRAVKRGGITDGEVVLSPREPAECHETFATSLIVTPLASAQRGGWLGRGKLRKKHIAASKDAKDGPRAEIAHIAHIPPSSNRRPIFNTPITLCAYAPAYAKR